MRLIRQKQPTYTSWRNLGGVPVIEFLPVAVLRSLANPTNGNSGARVIKRRCFNDGNASKFAAAAKIKPPHAREPLRNFDPARHRRAATIIAAIMVDSGHAVAV